MASTPAAVVHERLKAYANRGIFHDLRETRGRNGSTRFVFRVFDDQRVTVEVSERDQTLVIRHMLRKVPAEMYRDLQGFLAELFRRDRPSHRRLDRRSADAAFVKRRGDVSLVLTVKRRRYRYAADRLVSLLTWVRTYLQQWHPTYLWEVVGESEG